MHCISTTELLRAFLASAGASVQRKSVLDAAVIVELNALLDEAAANMLSVGKTADNVRNDITREEFTDGLSCTSAGTAVQLKKEGEVSVGITEVYNRNEGSASEEGTRSTQLPTATISLAIRADAQPYTYCWHSVLYAPDGAVMRESR